MTICLELTSAAGDDIGVRVFVRFAILRLGFEGIFSYSELSANHILRQLPHLTILRIE
jgi:hypothetical protein